MTRSEKAGYESVTYHLFPDSMISWALPFRRWPMHQHAAVAGLLLTVFFAGGWWYLETSKASLAALQLERRILQSQLNAAQNAVQVAVKADFGHALPNVSRADDVVRDISRFAQTLGVQIASLTVETHTGSSIELSRVQFNLVAHSEYKTGKAWLAALLGRYPSLGIYSISIRAQPNEALRQDIHLTLALFVKD